MSLEGFITSAGQVGADFQRSDGRAYLIMDQRVTDPDLLDKTIGDFSSDADKRGRRRWVARLRTTPEVISTLDPHLVEARIPLSSIGSSSDEVLILGDNVHRSDIPEWDKVYKYWMGKNGEASPADRVKKVRDEGYDLIDDITESDVPALTAIWRPFGWTEKGVSELVTRLPYDRAQGKRWFSGVVQRSTNRLVAACMGERLDFAGVPWCEGTEYGTDINFTGNGLGTAVVINLQAQMLEHTLYKDGETPLIVAELNISPGIRADVLARNTGMTVPYVEGVLGLEAPRQVLRRNVAIVDGDPRNNLNPRGELGEDYSHYQDAFGESDPSYLRNFIVGVLTSSVIASSYSPEEIGKIRSHVADRR